MTRARRWLVLACALALPAWIGCRPSSAKERDMSASAAEISIVESPEAKGADRMLLSPDGRWMALQFGLEAELPLLVRLDRKAGQPPAVARGLLGGPPRNDGTVFFIEQEAPDMRQVLAGSADERRSHLRRLGSPDRLLSRDGAYGAWPVDDDRVLVFGGRQGGPEELLIADARSGQVLTTREPLTGLGSMVWSLVDSGRIYLLFDPSWAKPPRNDGLIIVTLAADDLRELWRREGIQPTPLFTRASLGTTAAGRTLLLVSEVSADVASFDASTGAPGPLLQIPIGSNVLRFVHEARPREEALVLWTQRARGANGPRDWQMLSVRGDRIDVVADRPKEMPPGAAAWDGQKVLLAPWGAPRSAEQPAAWEEPFAGYMKQLGGAGR